MQATMPVSITATNFTVSPDKPMRILAMVNFDLLRHFDPCVVLPDKIFDPYVSSKLRPTMNRLITELLHALYGSSYIVNEENPDGNQTWFIPIPHHQDVLISYDYRLTEHDLNPDILGFTGSKGSENGALVFTFEPETESQRKYYDLHNLDRAEDAHDIREMVKESRMHRL